MKTQIIQNEQIDNNIQPSINIRLSSPVKKNNNKYCLNNISYQNNNCSLININQSQKVKCNDVEIEEQKEICDNNDYQEGNGLNNGYQKIDCLEQQNEIQEINSINNCNSSKVELTNNINVDQNNNINTIKNNINENNKITNNNKDRNRKRSITQKMQTNEQKLQQSQLYQQQQQLQIKNKSINVMSDNEQKQKNEINQSCHSLSQYSNNSSQKNLQKRNTLNYSHIQLFSNRNSSCSISDNIDDNHQQNQQKLCQNQTNNSQIHIIHSNSNLNHSQLNKNGNGNNNNNKDEVKSNYKQHLSLFNHQSNNNNVQNGRLSHNYSQQDQIFKQSNLTHRQSCINNFNNFNKNNNNNSRNNNNNINNNQHQRLSINQNQQFRQKSFTYFQSNNNNKNQVNRNNYNNHDNQTNDLLKNQQNKNYINNQQHKYNINNVLKKNQSSYEEPYSNVYDLENPTLSNPQVQQFFIESMQKITKSSKEKNFIKRVLLKVGLFEQQKDIIFKNQNTNDTLFDNLNLEVYDKHQVVFHIGEFGNKYYIIVQGGVYLLLPHMGKQELIDSQKEQKDSVFVNYMNSIQNSYTVQLLKKTRQPNNNNAKNDENNDNIKNKKKIYLSQCTFFIRTLLQHKQNPKIHEWIRNIGNDEQKLSLLFGGLDNEKRQLISASFLEREAYVNIFYPGMNIYKTFTPGDTFGEIALLTKQRRTATMICTEKTYCLSLTKQGFEQIIGAYQKSLIQSQIKFLQQFSFMEKIPVSKLLSIIHDFQKMEYVKDQTVYKEGDLSEYFYFVSEGDFEISRIEKSTNNNKEKQEPNTNNNNMKQKQQDQSNEINDAFSELNRFNKIKEINQQIHRIPLVILSSNTFFGQLEILKNINKRETKVICKSLNGILFQLPKNILLHHLVNWNSLQELVNQDKLLNNFSNQRINQVLQVKQIPNSKYQEFFENNKKKSKKKKEIQQENNNNNNNSSMILQEQQLLLPQYNEESQQYQNIQDLQKSMELSHQVYSDIQYNSFHRSLTFKHNSPSSKTERQRQESAKIKIQELQITNDNQNESMNITQEAQTSLKEKLQNKNNKIIKILQSSQSTMIEKQNSLLSPHFLDQSLFKTKSLFTTQQQQQYQENIQQQNTPKTDRSHNINKQSNVIISTRNSSQFNEDQILTPSQQQQQQQIQQQSNYSKFKKYQEKIIQGKVLELLKEQKRVEKRQSILFQCILDETNSISSSNNISPNNHHNKNNNVNIQKSKMNLDEPQQQQQQQSTSQTKIIKSSTFIDNINNTSVLNTPQKQSTRNNLFFGNAIQLYNQQQQQQLSLNNEHHNQNVQSNNIMNKSQRSFKSIKEYQDQYNQIDQKSNSIIQSPQNNIIQSQKKRLLNSVQSIKRSLTLCNTINKSNDNKNNNLNNNLQNNINNSMNQNQSMSCRSSKIMNCSQYKIESQQQKNSNHKLQLQCDNSILLLQQDTHNSIEHNNNNNKSSSVSLSCIPKKKSFQQIQLQQQQQFTNESIDNNNNNINSNISIIQEPLLNNQINQQISYNHTNNNNKKHQNKDQKSINQQKKAQLVERIQKNVYLNRAASESINNDNKDYYNCDPKIQQIRELLNSSPRVIFENIKNIQNFKRKYHKILTQRTNLSPNNMFDFNNKTDKYIFRKLKSNSKLALNSVFQTGGNIGESQQNNYNNYNKNNDKSNQEYQERNNKNKPFNFQEIKQLNHSAEFQNEIDIKKQFNNTTYDNIQRDYQKRLNIPKNDNNIMSGKQLQSLDKIGRYIQQQQQTETLNKRLNNKNNILKKNNDNNNNSNIKMKEDIWKLERSLSRISNNSDINSKNNSFIYHCNQSIPQFNQNISNFHQIQDKDHSNNKSKMDSQPFKLDNNQESEGLQQKMNILSQRNQKSNNIIKKNFKNHMFSMFIKDEEDKNNSNNNNININNQSQLTTRIRNKLSLQKKSQLENSQYSDQSQQINNNNNNTNENNSIFLSTISKYRSIDNISKSLSPNQKQNIFIPSNIISNNIIQNINLSLNHSTGSIEEQSYIQSTPMKTRKTMNQRIKEQQIKSKGISNIESNNNNKFNQTQHHINKYNDGSSSISGQINQSQSSMLKYNSSLNSFFQFDPIVNSSITHFNQDKQIYQFQCLSPQKIIKKHS